MTRLHAILDVDAADRAGWRPEALATAFFDGGASFLQVRAKRLASGAFLAVCDDVVRTGHGRGVRIIVNDRVDLAAMSGADGVHVGQDDLSPADARTQLGPAAIVGVSTHTVGQIQAAVREPVTYVAVGPVFGSATKDTGYEAVGLDLVRIARKLAPPEVGIVAIGGITLDTAPSVIEAGASMVAVIGDLLVGDPRKRVAAYCRALM